MPLHKRSKVVGDGITGKGKADEKKSKRQRLASFFNRSRKQKTTVDDNHPAPTPVPVGNETPRKPARDSKIAESPKPTKSSNSIDGPTAGVEEADEASIPTPPLEEQEQHKEEPKPEPLSEEHLHSLFSGAPIFSMKQLSDRPVPAASYPWDAELAIKDVSDSVQLAQPAFSAATLHRHLPVLKQSAHQEKIYQGYNLDVVEVPSLLGAQGLDIGTIGFAHFLELPLADSLVTDLQQSQSSNEHLESMRNKETMQKNPERLGIKKAHMPMVYDRLVEFGDLYELFNDSPERMTILNNQSPGDLYANLFGKFLTPPRYDDSADDPTGLKVQIDTLLKILRLKGVWYDFSLVEWRIRLGQILWSDAELESEHDPRQLWTERDILLLQITLACELLLRLDAVTSMDVDEVKRQMHVSPEDVQGFLNLKTRKTNWDLVLARRFLENILVIKEDDDATPTTEQKPRGFMSLLGSNAAQEAQTPDAKADIIFLPQHQARQLSGLLHFAQTIQWPGIETVLIDLAQKLGVPEASQEQEQFSPYGKFIDPSTPSSISVYGTPLASPRSNELLDSYFGHLQRPALSRDNSCSLQVPLSTTLMAQADGPGHTLNVGGWLSRSYLTGLILPGEATSHFLMSTLLENDKFAIAALGDSANLYGGFVYSGRTWWSKASIVARVLGCVDGAVECMGWVSFTKLPENLPDGWYAVSSEPPVSEEPPRIAAGEDLVLRDSNILPDGIENSICPTDLTLPRDAESPPIPSFELKNWNLTAINMNFGDTDAISNPSVEAETSVASVTLSSLGRTNVYTFSLTHDVQFISSWPCTPPSSSATSSAPHVKRSQQPLTRTSSKRSMHSTRSMSNRSSNRFSRRNSHGFEPLLSHPPDSPGILPTRLYTPIPDEDGMPTPSPSPRPEPLNAHPLHITYKYKLMPATEVLDPNFTVPFTKSAYAASVTSVRKSSGEENNESEIPEDNNNILILDARASKDLELLARAWCAEKGHHAIIGRVARTCLACCVREARGLGVSVIIRV